MASFLTIRIGRSSVNAQELGGRHVAEGLVGAYVVVGPLPLHRRVTIEELAPSL